MFLESNGAFLLILKFCLDPWKNRDGTLLLKITFTRLRLLGVKENSKVCWVALNHQN
jgi:hypothetical protein